MDSELSFIVGVLLGAFLAVGLTAVAINDWVNPSTLNKAGIERIEKCHNTHSNWVEIVWLNRVASGTEQDGRVAK